VFSSRDPVFTSLENAMSGARIMKRRRFKQTTSLKERLIGEADRLKRKARHAPAGKARTTLFSKARQMEEAAELNDLLGRSPSKRRRATRHQAG
jgi:hypothetical protein